MSDLVYQLSAKISIIPDYSQKMLTFVKVLKKQKRVPNGELPLILFSLSSFVNFHWTHQFQNNWKRGVRGKAACACAIPRRVRGKSISTDVERIAIREKNGCGDFGRIRPLTLHE